MIRPWFYVFKETTEIFDPVTIISMCKLKDCPVGQSFVSKEVLQLITDYFLRCTGMPNAELPAISVARRRAHFIPFGKSNETVFLP